MKSLAESSPQGTPGSRVRAQLLWLKVHRWIGLGLLVVFAVFAITGCALVWPVAFEKLMHPARFGSSTAAQPVPLASALLNAQAALGASDTVAAARFVDGDSTLLFVGQIAGPPNFGLGPPRRHRAYVDRGSGTVLTTWDGRADAVWWMRALHGHLLIRSYGREIVAGAGLFLLASGVSGLWLWWPGRKRVAAALKWRKQASVSMNLHRQTGAAIVIVLLVETFTGIYVAVPGVFAKLIDPQASSEHGPEGPPASPTRKEILTSIDTVARSALAAAPPAARLESIFLPTERSSMWVVNVATNDGAMTVLVDDGTRAATVRPAAAPTAAERVERVMIDTHFGRLGTVWSIIVFLSGVILTLLAITGLTLWLERRRRGGGTRHA
jgi:uncharacterized iron-regulated membrane protein